MFASSDALGSASPAEIPDSFVYTETESQDEFNYKYIPTGNYTFDLAATDTGIASSLPITSANPQLTAAIEYTLITTGYTAADPALGLQYTTDSNRSIVTQASIKLLHGVPLAGTLDFFATPAEDFTKELENAAADAPLLDDFTFGTITDYVPVPLGDYDIRLVTDDAVGTAAINIEGFILAAGSVSTVIAREPVSDGDPADFTDTCARQAVDECQFETGNLKQMTAAA